MLTNLCPFFLKPLDVDGKDWLEMPASTLEGGDGKTESSPQKKRGRKLTKEEAKGLKEVKEIIQRELALRDD
jgi:hypothetical protein